MTWYLTPQETADRLHVPVRRLTEWRYKKCGPPYVKVPKSKLVIYSEPVLDDWLHNNTVNFNMEKRYNHEIH